MTVFSTTGRLTYELEDDPFDWVGESDGEEHFPHPREQVRESFEGKPFIKNIGTTVDGLILNCADHQRHSSLGRMIRKRGWVVDYINWEDGVAQIVPLPEEVLQR